MRPFLTSALELRAELAEAAMIAAAMRGGGAVTHASHLFGASASS
jgi:hypothetical protein